MRETMLKHILITVFVLTAQSKLPELSALAADYNYAQKCIKTAERTGLRLTAKYLDVLPNQLVLALRNYINYSDKTIVRYRENEPTANSEGLLFRVCEIAVGCSKKNIIWFDCFKRDRWCSEDPYDCEWPNP